MCECVKVLRMDEWFSRDVTVLVSVRHREMFRFVVCVMWDTFAICNCAATEVLIVQLKMAYSMVCEILLVCEDVKNGLEFMLKMMRGIM